MAFISMRGWDRVLLCAVALFAGIAATAQQPVEPVDRSPQDGQAYALMSRATGLELSSAGTGVGVATRDLTSVDHHWGLVRLIEGSWKVENQATGRCLAAAEYDVVTSETCSYAPLENWRIVEGANGYSTLANVVDNKLLTAGAGLTVTAAAASPAQSQLWQLRPAFWRGADVAEQEKMEAIRAKVGLPFWKDAEQPEDILKILKDHGFNSIRLRPTSIPPYYPSQPANTCTGNYCYIETDAQELDLAKRARNLGFSLELTLFFDGGSPIPAPLTCIHITPQYDMTSFFTSANQNGLEYDAICQSYYPIFHGPLTQAQANQTNPNNQPVEAKQLMAAAQAIGKPIYILETAEHYENGFEYNDPWYQPTVQQQRQFLLDLESVLHSLPHNLAMGMEYWAPNDVEMPDGGGPYSTFQKDYTSPNAIFAWEGLGLFDSADPNYLTDSAAPNYATALPGLDAVGGKLDPTLTYKLTNRLVPVLLGGDGRAVVISLLTELDGAVDTPYQWRIASDNSGEFTLANVHATGNATPVVLDGLDANSNSGQPLVSELAADGTAGQSWDMRTAGGGYSFLINKATGLVLSLDAAGRAIEVAMTSVGQQGQWAITPVAISRGD